MHRTQLRQVGGSVMLAVPPAVLNMLSLKVGATVALSIDEGRLVLEPSKRLKYSLKQLLAEHSSESRAFQAGDDRWTSDGAQGGELI